MKDTTAPRAADGRAKDPMAGGAMEEDETKEWRSATAGMPVGAISP